MLQLPDAVPTAVPLWQPGLQQEQVLGRFCTWHAIPQVSQERRLGKAQGQVQLPLVWPLVPFLPGCLHQMLPLP